MLHQSAASPKVDPDSRADTRNARTDTENTGDAACNLTGEIPASKPKPQEADHVPSVVCPPASDDVTDVPRYLQFPAAASLARRTFFHFGAGFPDKSIRSFAQEKIVGGMHISWLGKWGGS